MVIVYSGNGGAYNGASVYSHHQRNGQLTHVVIHIPFVLFNAATQ